MAVPCHCLNIDGVCRQVFETDFGVPTTARPDAGPLPTTVPVVISASVGLGGSNRAEDVTNIQRALNHLLPEVGGAVPFLDDDGLVGKKTCAAIARFQKVNFGWADSRVDPEQKTLARINTLLAIQPKNPFNGDPNQRVAFAISRLRSASQCLLAAEQNINAVLPFVGRPAPSGVFGAIFADRMALLERHFKISDFSNDAFLQLVRLRDTYQDMRSVIVKSVPANPDDDNLFANFVGGSVFAFDPHEEQLSPTTMAYTSLGGMRRKGELFFKPPRPADRIYLRALMDRCSDTMFTQNIVHELAHFVSAGTPPIVDHAYGWINDPRMIVLPARLRVANAQNFTTYAFEAKNGQQNGRLAI